VYSGKFSKGFSINVILSEVVIKKGSSSLFSVLISLKHEEEFSSDILVLSDALTTSVNVIVILEFCSTSS